ncbi:S41 family peptidase [Vagococcus elongatus]
MTGIIVSVLLAVAGTYLVLKETQGLSSRTAQESQATLDGNLSSVEEVFNLILANYLGDVDEEELVKGAIAGMTAAIGDPYSGFYTGLDKEELDEVITGSFEGIGATMSLKNELPTISEPPIPGTPAERARLQENDVILKVDGVETAGKALTDVVKKIRGEKGTEVTLTIERGGDVFDVTLVRDTVPVHSVSVDISPENKSVGIVNVSTFSQNTGKEFNKGIEELRSSGATSFIIDLRGNPGGSLDQVLMMASRFLKDDQVILQVQDGEGKTEKITAGEDLDEGNKITEKTIVLVDRNSASASEIFAAALKENNRAEIIGEQTFGKGTMQVVKSLSEDTELKLTTNKWLTPDGNWLNEEGLPPSIEVAYPDYYEVRAIDTANSFQLGASGQSVESINQMLAALGYSSSETQDQFTDETVAGVKAFQEKEKLSVTGVVDKQTANQLGIRLVEHLKANDAQMRRALTEIAK